MAFSLDWEDNINIHHDDDLRIDDDESVGVEKVKEKARKRKGRVFTSENLRREVLENFEGLTGHVTLISSAPESEPSNVQAQRSLEGWILIATGIHEEANEDEVEGHFSEFGKIKNIHLNLDRRTGYLRGYALIEFENYKDAAAAKKALDGTDYLGCPIKVDWAFMKQPLPIGRRSRRLNIKLN